MTVIEMRANMTDLKAYAKGLKGRQDQLPYAIRLTLNKVAFEAMQALRGDFKKRFTIRTDWSWKTIRYTEARKGPRPFSAVFSTYDMLALHVTGGNKESREGGVVAVPVLARRTPSQKTLPRSFPERLLAKSDFFTRDLEDGRVGVFRRHKRKKVSKAKRRSRRGPNAAPAERPKQKVELYWVLMSQVRIRRGWPWDRVTARVTDDRILELFTEAWDRAQATAR